MQSIASIGAVAGLLIIWMTDRVWTTPLMILQIRIKIKRIWTLPLDPTFAGIRQLCHTCHDGTRATSDANIFLILTGEIQFFLSLLIIRILKITAEYNYFGGEDVYVNLRSSV